LGLRSIIGEAVTSKRDSVRSAVVNLNPVREFAVFVWKREVISVTSFIDNELTENDRLNE
jgi:hypothetical protein